MDINYKYLGYINKQNVQRKEALARQDASTYYSLCLALGMEPEDKFLFELGQLDIKCPIIDRQWDRTLFDFEIKDFEQQLQIERLRIDLGL